MAHYKIIQAVRIYLDVVAAENPSLGIYNWGTIASEIRLSEDVLSGTTLAWTHGLIAREGIGAITEGADLSRGGAVADYDGTSVELVNTSRYLQVLKDLGIYLTGCKCELWEFRGTEADSDATSAAVIYTGIVEDLSSTETALSIPIKSARYKRNANLTSTNANDATSPVTFGWLYSRNADKVQSLAKFSGDKSEKDESTYKHSYFAQASDYDDVTIFPVTTLAPAGEYEHRAFNITFASINNFGTAAVPYTDLYVEVVSGDGSGQINKVEQIVYINTYRLGYVVCSNVFGTDLSAGAEDRSWVKFFSQSTVNRADTWPCYSFLNDAGTSAAVPTLYGYENDQYSAIAPYSYDYTETDKNQLVILPTNITDEPTDINSFHILPIDNLAAEDAATLEAWNCGARTGYELFNKGILSVYPDGTPSQYASDVYYKGSLVRMLSESIVGDLANCYDRDYNTYYQITHEAGASPDEHNYFYILKFSPPELPKKLLNQDVSIYLGIRGNFSAWKTQGFNDFWAGQDGITGEANKFFHVVKKKLTGSPYMASTDAIFTSLSFGPTTPKGTVGLDDIPDFYYSSNVPSTSNLNFYHKSELVGGVYNDLNGYSLYDLNITKEEYATISELGLYFGSYFQSGYYGEISLKIYDICIIVKCNGIDVSQEVFSPLAGRVFDDSWGGRKSPTTAIESPVDIIEHCKRLQNWTETGETGIDWGKEYATSAQIDTATFDDVSLADVKTHQPAFQLFSENECATDAVVKRLCQTYNVISRIDADGDEQIYAMTRTSPTESVTFADVIGSIGEVKECPIQDIFCEPRISYGWDEASGTYTGDMRIFRIADYAAGTAIWSDCSSGFANQTDAELMLGIYAALYTRFRQVEECPSDFTEQKTIIEYADALAYGIAKGRWMGRQRLSLSVSYDKGKTYHFGTHLMVSLPHQTGSIEIETIVERISKDKNKNLVSLDLVLFDDIAIAWQNTVDTGTEYQNNETTGDEYQKIRT